MKPMVSGKRGKAPKPAPKSGGTTVRLGSNKPAGGGGSKGVKN